jgi:hypothetical protein
MKFAVVINVGQGPEALAHAMSTQSLLLEHMGEKLDSIRLAVPRLLSLACSSAVEERPDILAVAGGPRTARRGGQIAHRSGIPILFLPGLRSPAWGERVWGSLSLEDMVHAMAKEDIGLTRFGVGMAGEEIFFGDARCGLIPQLAHLNQAFREAQGFSEGWTVLGRASSLFRTLAGVRIGIRRPSHETCHAATLTVSAQASGNLSGAVSMPSQLTCTLWRHTPFGFLAAAARAAGGGDWSRYAERERFDCKELALDTHAAPWMVLDGEPIWFEDTAILRFMLGAVRVCAFKREKKGVNDNPAVTRPNILKHDVSRWDMELRGTAAMASAFS